VSVSSQCSDQVSINHGNTVTAVDLRVSNDPTNAAQMLAQTYTYTYTTHPDLTPPCHHMLISYIDARDTDPTHP